jgi:hypothetical protein
MCKYFHAQLPVFLSSHSSRCWLLQAEPGLSFPFFEVHTAEVHCLFFSIPETGVHFITWRHQNNSFMPHLLATSKVCKGALHDFIFGMETNSRHTLFLRSKWILTTLLQVPEECLTLNVAYRGSFINTVWTNKLKTQISLQNLKF